ncbi:MAG: glycosyltransferase [Firmicutes bacterium]|nr:glycosyltransferase [Alicyclobacillaceae bacterium]MCL6498325.1 glycosyltransferase [Bacillota bacterium]
MPEWFRRAAVVLNTSVTEGVSNALMEAMACGAAAVAADIPGNRALMADRKTGLLFRDGAEFMRNMHALQAGQWDAGEMGRAARQHILQHHAAEAAAYVRCYLVVLVALAPWRANGLGCL